MDHKCDLTEDNIYLNVDRSKEKTCHHRRQPPLSVRCLQLIILDAATLFQEGESGGRLETLPVLFLYCGKNNGETVSKCSVLVKGGHAYMYTKHIHTHANTQIRIPKISYLKRGNLGQSRLHGL